METTKYTKIKNMGINTLSAEEPWTVITLSSIYGNELQHNIFDYTSLFLKFHNKKGSVYWAVETFGGALSPMPMSITWPASKTYVMSLEGSC